MPCTAPAGAGIDTSQARTLHGLVLEDHPHPAGSAEPVNDIETAAVGIY